MFLFLIDGIGPFFRGLEEKRVNWSKIPFSHLESDDGLDLGRFQSIREDFRRLTAKTSSLGFNGITLDDVAHLVECDFYPPPLRSKIAQYRQELGRLFEIADDSGMQVYLTTDLMFYNEALEKHLGHDPAKICAFLSSAFDALFQDFPQLGGIILRIGESDGLDVRGDFKSKLTVRRPSQARYFLERLLPVFEQHRKLLIFRTWSVGAYSIGDLIWNRDTFDRTFGGLDSKSLVISMKPGESDFFRFLPLNKLFFRSGHQKIFEVQARREYEGCGEYPSFIGRHLDDYRRQLEDAEGLVGLSVWCQTGGWTKFKRLTYLECSSIWNELNTEVAIDLFKHGRTVDEAIRASWIRRFGDPDPQDNPDEKPSDLDRLTELLRLSDEVIEELLYVDELAEQKIFFRRSRLPPLLSVYWDRVLINHSMRKLLRCFVADGDAKIQQGWDAVAKIRRMIELAGAIDRPEHIPVDDLIFQLQTFEILALAREYYFGPFHPKLAKKLKKRRRKYKKTVRKPRYTLNMDFAPMSLRSVYLRWILAVFLRRKRGYRLIDQVFTVRALAAIYPIVHRFEHRLVPKFARKQAMGIESIFR